MSISTRLHTIVTSHGSLAVEESGQGGLPVLLIHGNSSCRGVFRHQLQGRLAENHRLIAFDALALARQHGTEANAVLLGALAGSDAVPISEAAFRKAIEAKGVAVKSNLAGFDLGLALARSPSAAGSAPAPPRPPPPPPARSPLTFD